MEYDVKVLPLRSQRSGPHLDAAKHYSSLMQSSLQEAQTEIDKEIAAYDGQLSRLKVSLEIVRTFAVAHVDGPSAAMIEAVVSAALNSHEEWEVWRADGFPGAADPKTEGA